MGTTRERYEAERAARWPGVDWDAIERDTEEERERRTTGRLIPGDDGYRAWVCSLSVGSAVDTRRTDGKTALAGLTISRLTATQFIMSDGVRFRRAGKHPGYKVGEDGRDGNRTYIMNPAARRKG